MTERPLPRVRSEERRPVLERRPPDPVFAFDPARDGTTAVARFLQGMAPPPRAAPAVPLYLRRTVVDTMMKEAREAAPLEAMGLLAGVVYRWKGETYAVVRDAVTGEREATDVTVRFAMERGTLFDALDRLDYPYVLVGWWHSHPGYSCFLSPTDVETQRRMFREPHHRAIVVDPHALDLRAFGVDGSGRPYEGPFAVVADSAPTSTSGGA
ncbi:MAG: Mov34/MPN/PAD-1 family protein [Methanobacteriota archaeon]